MKKRMIIGIIFLGICLSLIVYNELKNKYNTNIHDVTNSASEEENIKVYLDATFVAGAIEYNNENYYVIFGDGVQYFVKISDKKASEISKYLLDNPEKTYKIVGITKTIPRKMEENGIKFVNYYLNALHSDEGFEHSITLDEFYHYFGYVYLDATTNNVFIIILISLTGVIGVLFIFDDLVKKVDFL